MELYSDESGSTGAGIDDVSKTDAAYDTSKGPEEAAKGIEKEVSRRAFSFLMSSHSLTPSHPTSLHRAHPTSSPIKSSRH
jgi:hypothetical protein